MVRSKDDLLNDVINNIKPGIGGGIVATNHQNILVDILNNYVHNNDFAILYRANSVGVTFVVDTYTDLAGLTPNEGEKAIVLDESVVYQYTTIPSPAWVSLGTIEDQPIDSPGTVRVNVNDTTADYLANQLQAGAGISLTTDVGNGFITVASTAVGGVTSVFTRSGNVTAADNDYTASQIANVQNGNIVAVTVQAAIDELDSEKAIDSLVVHKAGTETITGAKTINSLGTTILTNTPSAPSSTFELSDGSYLILNADGATGDITLTLSNPIAGGSYMMEVIQGVISYDIVFPAGTITANGSGNTVLGIASTTQLISFAYNGSNFRILGTGGAE